MSSIRLKLTLLFIFVSIVPAAIIGFYSLDRSTNVITSSTNEYLDTAIRMKQAVLENYIETTISIGDSLSRMDVFQDYLNTASQIPKSERVKNPVLLPLAKRVEDVLFGLQEANWGRYHHIFLIDDTNRIVISPNHGEKVKGSPSAHLNEDTSRNKYAVEALRRGKTVISDYSSWVESNHTHQMVFYPMADSSGKVRAVVGFELQIPYEESILSAEFKLGDTGKIYLSTLRGQPITYDGIDERDVIAADRLVEIEQNGFSAGRRINSQGVEVIGKYIRNEKYPWIIAAEVETAEALGSIEKLQKLTLIGMALTLLVAIFLAIAISSTIVSPIKKITDQMTKASMGDLNQNIDGLDRKDEIGDLLKAFNRVLTSLKMATSHYKKLRKRGA